MHYGVGTPRPALHDEEPCSSFEVHYDGRSLDVYRFGERELAQLNKCATLDCVPANPDQDLLGIQDQQSVLGIVYRMLTG
jgi:hypothetical protein